MTRTRRTPIRPRGNVARVASASPTGSAADVLAWVGEDKARALVALEAEHAADKPRSTLIKTLERLTGADQ